MVQNYAFGGGASASQATLLRSARTWREYRLMRESKMNLNSSLVQEVWKTRELYTSGAVSRTLGRRFQGIEGKSWCSLW
jgi:hypothetical protein